MKARKDDILLSADCDKGTENEFNYLELINGDIKLVHAKTGWCVAPKSPHSDELSLKPCNKGTIDLYVLGSGGGRRRRHPEKQESRQMPYPGCACKRRSCDQGKAGQLF